MAHFLTATVMPLQSFKTYQWKDMKERKTYREEALLIAARMGDDHLLMASQGNISATYKAPASPEGSIPEGWVGAGKPWIRIATSPSPITSLKGTADDKGLITVEYTTADGVQHPPLHLDEKRHVER